jgi:hypothetical protein
MQFLCLKPQTTENVLVSVIVDVIMATFEIQRVIMSSHFSYYYHSEEIEAS